MVETIGLWRKNGIKGGKYLVQRRDGTVPEWPYFVLGARDPYAPAALRAYAKAAEEGDADPTYVRDLLDLADEYDNFRSVEGPGDPDAKPHRKDDPEVVKRMKLGA
jgi:hypothetical protein